MPALLRVAPPSLRRRLTSPPLAKVRKLPTPPIYASILSSVILHHRHRHHHHHHYPVPSFHHCVVSACIVIPIQTCVCCNVSDHLFPDNADVTTDSIKAEASTNADAAAKPLAPPPRPGQQQGNNTPDYFSNQPGGSLSLEPNPFEQSFGGGSGPETPGGTKLPSVAALTSPSSLLPGSNATPFNWGGGSLRTGPLSPAMLSGPTSDYFSDTHHLRGGFPTPNESGLRSGLTPGGSGSMFPAPSPNSQALFNQLASGGATPSTLDFHRTAISAAAKRDQTQVSNTSQPVAQPTQQPPQPVTTQPQDMTNGVSVVKGAAKSFDPHDNDAANGLFMLAQGAQQRNGAQNGTQFTATTVPAAHAHPATVNPHVSPQMSSVNGGSVGSARGVSEASNMSEESEPRPNTRGKGKRTNSAANGRKKADEAAAKVPPSKKSKANNGGAINGGSYDEEVSDPEDDTMKDEDGPKGKMTDEEKRKNFLERNRYVRFAGIPPIPILC